MALGPILPIVPRDHQWEEATNEINDFFDRYIEVAISGQLGSSKPTAGEQVSVLSELTNQTQNPLYIRDQLLSLFLPLHNSGPIVISDFFFQVARRPEVFSKMRAEVLEMGDVTLTFEVLKSMKYLQCVIRESKWPAVPQP